MSILRAFEQERVEYAVFGAVALNIHGIGRATEDLDVLTRLGELADFESLEIEIVQIEGLPVRVVSPRQLYRLKAGTVRGQDRVDAELLREKFDLDDSES